tara:strand:- start:33 stop:794 length:762 start_codon:yes stop_codon:yes gene_type:complete
MHIEGIDLDISPFTFKEWGKLNPDLEQAVRALFKTSKDFNHQIPCGYSRNLENPRLGDPIPKDLHVLMQVLDRVRFQENMLITESLAVFRSKGLNIKTTQSVNNTLDRLEGSLDLLLPLPKGVHAKAKDNRQRLEWQRKRRTAKRDKDKKKELIAERKRIEKALSKETNKRIKVAKSSKMTAEEMKGKEESLESKIIRLKTESEGSRFDNEIEKPKDTVVLFEPTPKQAEFLAAPEKVVFYGGFRYPMGLPVS